jgi:asparagine synthase (glutamine-hydrolysing)
MCGITGYIDFHSSALGRFSPDEHHRQLLKMNDAIVHRGPDEDGYYHNANYHLAMRRLSIIDLTTGRQPIFNEDKTIAIVFNGEIYNFHELKRDLEKQGHSFRTHSDTEVIVHLYEQYGFECVKKLTGMFSFALHDQNKDLLFCSRDRVGEKPFHYYFENGMFVFGSEIKSILQMPMIPNELDYGALNAYLTFEYVPAPRSIYKNIYKLQQGHSLILQRGQLRIEKYWGLDQIHHRFNGALPPESESIATLEELLKKSVEMQMISDVPLGAFLSGGLDSSMVTAMMTRFSEGKVNTFNIAFDDASFDESSYARRVAKHLQTDHHEEVLNPQKLLDIIPDVFSRLDEPFADASLIPTYLLSKFTKEHVTVALSGDGSDELFAGYPTYRAHILARNFPKILHPAFKHLADLLPVNDDNISFDFKVKKFISGIPYSVHERNQIWLGSFEPHQKCLLLNKNTKSQIADNEFAFLTDHLSQCRSDDFLNRILYQDMRFYLQDNMLVKVDRASMMASLEVRVPFLNHQLVEFVYGLPSYLKLHRSTSKYLLKKLAEKYLPSEIVHRNKKGFGIPVAKWIKKDLKTIFFEYLSESRIRREGIFEPAYVSGLMNDHLNNKRDNRKPLWTLFVFQLWNKRSF